MGEIQCEVHFNSTLSEFPLDQFLIKIVLTDGLTHEKFDHWVLGDHIFIIVDQYSCLRFGRPLYKHTPPSPTTLLGGLSRFSQIICVCVYMDFMRWLGHFKLRIVTLTFSQIWESSELCNPSNWLYRLWHSSNFIYLEFKQFCSRRNSISLP